MIFRTAIILCCFALAPSIGYGQGGLFSGDGTALRILGAVGQSMNNQGQGQNNNWNQPQNNFNQPQNNWNQPQNNNWNRPQNNNWNQPQQGFGQQQPNFGRHTTYKPGSYQANGNGGYNNNVTGSHYIPNKGVLKSNGRFYKSIGNGVYQHQDGATYMPSTGQYNSGARGYIPPR